MAWKWPWTRAQDDIDGLVTRVASAAAEEATSRALAKVDAAREATESLRAEVERATLQSPIRDRFTSPMAGTPNQSVADAPYPLYAFDEPFSYYTPQPPTRKPGSQLTTKTLRQLAENFDVLRACLSHLQREVRNVPIEIVARGDDKASTSDQKRIQSAEEWFDTGGGIGGRGRGRAEFETEIVEDVCVVGAAALFFQPTRGRQVYEVVNIDSATIRARVDAFGWPGPDEEWYEQWIYGVKVRGFTRAEMFYSGIYPRSWTPYFASPVEWLVSSAATLLNVDIWNRTWLTDGNEPGRMISLPENSTPAQVRDYAEWFFQMLAGDPKARHRVRFVPGGSQQVTNPSRKDQDFEAFWMTLMRRTCSIMGVQPVSIGYVGETYKTAQETGMDQTSEFGVAALLEFRQTIYNEILTRLGFADLECRNVTKREEDATSRAERNVKLVAGGIKTLNEARSDEGLDPDPDGDVLLVQGTLVPVGELVEQAAAATDLAQNPPAPMANGQNGAGGPTDEGTAPQTADNSGRESASRRAASLWERKALRRLKEGKSPAVGFSDAALPAEWCERVAAGLAVCTTPEQVRGLFSVEVIQLPPTYAGTVERDAQREIARRWRDRRLQRERDADKT